jgi:putative tryptophan/tyrosine transport system substrate-binding protein
VSYGKEIVMSAHIGDVRTHPRDAGERRQESVGWLRLTAGTITLVLAILSAPLAAAAQPSVKVPRMGVLLGSSQPSPSCSSPRFVRALQELGYIEGQIIIIVWRCAEGRADLARQFAVELVQLQVDIIVSDFRAATLAAKTATSTIPIVFVGGGDPVPEFVPNLAQPGGNVTGVGNLAGWEFFAKHLELLMEAVPGVTRVALLLVARDPFNAERTQPVEMAARARGIQLHRVEVEGPHDFERAFAAMTQEGIDALLVSFTPLLGLHSAQLGALAAQHRLPAIFASRAFVVQGGLMSYHWANLWPRVASYVDRILKGTKPANLPVELPTKYELVLNRKTAQALGITFPPSLLVLADEVIR